jgi:hypothetical protein
MTTQSTDADGVTGTEPVVDTVHGRLDDLGWEVQQAIGLSLLRDCTL